MGISEKMQSKWYMLSLTGSLSKVNTFVRKYTDQSERGGVLIGKKNEWERRNFSQPKDTLPNDSIISNTSRSSGDSSRRTMKRSNNSKTLDVRIECKRAKCDEKAVVADSPRMREFFKEVKQRELKEYYLRMRAAQRMSQQIERRTERDIMHNVYCRGPKKLC
ncbi:uncharacterized protein LOC111073895 [Drosophila obscura]|uniref:uncharacterized protein LOC111073895 n=1 Tax=Drosophila obscura TaxID=7282 RepID=UPI000B9FEEAA|nr:uncharacterized protein LOC111073895 [Drosophila obscura]